MAIVVSKTIFGIPFAHGATKTFSGKAGARGSINQVSNQVQVTLTCRTQARGAGNTTGIVFRVNDVERFRSGNVDMDHITRDVTLHGTGPKDLALDCHNTIADPISATITATSADDL